MARKQLSANISRIIQVEENMFCSSVVLGIAASQTLYSPVFGGEEYSNTELDAENIVPVAISASKLYVKVNPAPGIGHTITFTLRKNNADTGVTIAIAGTSTIGNDSINTSTFAPGDVISMKIANSGSSATTLAIFGFKVL